jgi:hypothetical protein
LFRSTPERQLAGWLFLRWFTEPEQQARWARTFDALPVRVSTRELLQDHIAENPQYGRALDFLDGETVIEPGVIGYGECYNSIREMLVATADRGEPSPWLADATQKCQDSLE